MLGRKIFTIGLWVFSSGIPPLVAPPAFSHATWSHGPHGHGHGGRGRGIGAGWPVFLGFGATGMYAPIAPIVFVGPAMFFPSSNWMTGQPMMGGGQPLPAPPPGLARGAPAPNNPPAVVQRSDPARSNQLMTVGDRLFRAGNFKRAEERYQQALRAAPDLAAPHIRLAQIAVVRGNYGEAAERFRKAETAQPGWIITAADIQSIYAEPAAFARSIARIESHLQLHPDDRDAWLALGAQWFLSGRTAKAANVFQRLNDPKRKADVALSAFLDASNQRRLEAPKLDDE
jgi:Tetratricopeptide repeat